MLGRARLLAVTLVERQGVGTHAAAMVREAKVVAVEKKAMATVASVGRSRLVVATALMVAAVDLPHLLVVEVLVVAAVGRPHLLAAAALVVLAVGRLRLLAEAGSQVAAVDHPRLPSAAASVVLAVGRRRLLAAAALVASAAVGCPCLLAAVSRPRLLAVVGRPFLLEVVELEMAAVSHPRLPVVDRPRLLAAVDSVFAALCRLRLQAAMMAWEAVVVGRWGRQVVWVLGWVVLPNVYRLVVRRTGRLCVFFSHGPVLMIVTHTLR